MPRSYIGNIKDNIYMDEHLDVINHGNVISIWDMHSDLEISNSKWDFVFEYLLSQTSEIYFRGFRLWVNEKDVLSNINYLSEKMLLNRDEAHILLFKIKLSSIILSRNLLSKMWEYYEYPLLVFLKDTTQEKKLTEICGKLPRSKGTVANSLENCYTVYKSSQPDVLWIEKSKDVSFPWATYRSPKAIDLEQNTSWIKKALKAIGFWGDVRIKRS